MPVVVVLGGSTPFTAALIEALRDARDALPACELRLYGQDAEALERMRRYADRRLTEYGWSSRAFRRLDEAVDGASVVVNQIRFGGLAGRADDEALANRFQLPADETLGPCGLSSAFRVIPRIHELAAELGRRCPDAWVLNLSNPLSLTTRAMIDAGGPSRTIGLCELPAVTALEACRLLGMSPEDVQWKYAGLNHRGFIFALEHRGEDVLQQVPELLGDRTLFGVSAQEIRNLKAIPLKYFRLSTTPTRPAPSHRAEFLTHLRDQLTHELDAGAAPPPSLSQRYLAWYDGAVVPMLVALFANDGRRVIVDCPREDGLVHELPARVFRDDLELIEDAPPPRLRSWLDCWAAHEHALQSAVRTPSLERIEHALSLDPAIPSAQVGDLGRAIWEQCEQRET